jgi:hypothetical protein
MPNGSQIIINNQGKTVCLAYHFFEMDICVKVGINRIHDIMQKS